MRSLSFYLKITICLGYTFCILLWSASAFGQDTTGYRGFVKKVKSLYNNLTFSGVDFEVTSIKLKPVPFGLSFARYDSKVNQRVVLFNYNYFYEKYWLPVKDTLKRQQDVLDMVSGVLAHEWAHHYMGHTFERNSIINERNADILAGRIMYENLVDDPNKDSIEDKLRRSLRSIDVLENAPQNVYHLSAQTRQGLINKGFNTGLVLYYKKNGRAEQLIRKLVKAKIAALESQTALVQDSLCTVVIQKVKDDFISRLPDSLQAKISVSSCYSLSASSALPDSLVRVMLDVTNKAKMLYRDTLSKRKETILGPFLKSGSIDEDKIKAFIENPQSISVIGIEAEAVYNLLYDGDNTPGIAEPFIRCKYRAANADTLTYKLQYGKTTVIKVYREEIGRAEIYEDGRRVGSGKVNLLNIGTKKDKLFLYSFEINKVKYFIDRNYHLWSETFGAKAIGNKLFLQTNDFKIP